MLGAGLLEGFGRQADADLVLIALQTQGLEELLGWGISGHWGCAGEAAAGHAHRDMAEAQQKIQVPAAGEIQAGLEIRLPHAAHQVGPIGQGDALKFKGQLLFHHRQQFP